jgi:hypothetical protein
LIKTYNFGQNAANKRQLKNKSEQFYAVRLFIFEAAETFCQFFARNCQYFLPYYSLINVALKSSTNLISDLNANNMERKPI